MAISNRAAFVLALVLVAVVACPASASTLTAFSGPACAGSTKDLNGCGCFSLAGFHGGFHFVFTEGQRARLYSDSYCHGYSELLRKETRRCGHHHFRSIRMLC